MKPLYWRGDDGTMWVADVPDSCVESDGGLCGRCPVVGCTSHIEAIDYRPDPPMIPHRKCGVGHVLVIPDVDIRVNRDSISIEMIDRNLMVVARYPMRKMEPLAQ